MKIFITDNDGNLITIDGKSVVIELNNGKTIEIAEEYGRDDIPEGINLWGGREPSLPSHLRKSRPELKASAFTPLQPMLYTFSRTKFRRKIES